MPAIGRSDRKAFPRPGSVDGARADAFLGSLRVEPSFPSSRFRIRLVQPTDVDLIQCMHIRGFELFGAILPPWRIDVLGLSR